jgi:hypothetical protein
VRIRNSRAAHDRYDHSIMKQLSIVYALLIAFSTVQAAEYALQEFDVSGILSDGIARDVVANVQTMPLRVEHE